MAYIKLKVPLPDDLGRTIVLESIRLPKPEELLCEPETPRLLTVAEAADRLSVDKATVYRLIKRGRLRGVRVGARALEVERKSLESFIAGKR